MTLSDEQLSAIAARHAAATKWLYECARYMESRDTKGGDRAHWANVYNAENTRQIPILLADLLAHVEAQAKEIERLRAPGDLLLEATDEQENVMVQIWRLY